MNMLKSSSGQHEAGFIWNCMPSVWLPMNSSLVLGGFEWRLVNTFGQHEKYTHFNISIHFHRKFLSNEWHRKNPDQADSVPFINSLFTTSRVGTCRENIRFRHLRECYYLIGLMSNKLKLWLARYPSYHLQE